MMRHCALSFFAFSIPRCMKAAVAGFIVPSMVILITFCAGSTMKKQRKQSRQKRSFISIYFAITMLAMNIEGTFFCSTCWCTTLKKSRSLTNHTGLFSFLHSIKWLRGQVQYFHCSFHMLFCHH